MKIELKHPAIELCTPFAWEKLLTNCETLSKFCSRLDRYSELIRDTPSDQPNLYYENPKCHLSGLDTASKFKGDVFEILAELIIRSNPADDRIGIHDYHVVISGDTGVDGYGLSREGNPVTVQAKYRLWDKTLNEYESHLHNFSLSSRNRYGVDTDEPGRMLLITTGKELHWKTVAKFSGGMKCISRGASYGCLRGAPRKTVDDLFSLKTIVDGSIVFWDTFRNQTTHA